MAMQWTIYYDHERPNGSKDSTTVLLDSGCWTDQNNCNRREQYAPEVDPIVMCRPRLFATRGGASLYKKVELGGRRCYRVAKYTGPTDPESRPIRKVYELINGAKSCAF